MSDKKLTVGELVYKISGDMDNLKTELKQADKQIRALEKSMGKTQKATNKMSEGLSRLGKTAIVAFALSKVKSFFQSAVLEASNLTESVNAVNVVFGSAAGTILDFGKTSATSVGLATADFNQLATSTGGLLSKTGLSMDEVAAKTIMLTKRAADMASVHNTSVKDALSAVNQALRGETEAIRRYTGGVTDAELQTFLLSQGINKQVSSLSQQEKTLLRVDKIMSDTAKTQGDFENTSATLANRMRILDSQFKNLKGRIGTALLPALESVVNSIDLSASAGEDAEEKFQEMSKTIYSVTNFIVAMGHAFLVLVKGIVKGGTTAVRNFVEMGASFMDTVDSVKRGGKTFGALFTGIVKSVLNLGKNFFNLSKGIRQALTGQFKKAKSTFKDGFVDVFDFSKLADQLEVNGVEKQFSRLEEAQKKTATVLAKQSEGLSNSLERVAEARDRSFNRTGYQAISLEASDAARSSAAFADSAENVAGKAEKASGAVGKLNEKLVSAQEESQKASEKLNDELGKSFDDFTGNIAKNTQETSAGLAEIALQAETKAKELRDAIAGADDSDTRSQLQGELASVQEVLSAREGFEERQAERIAGIRAKLEANGIDAAKAGLDNLFSVRTLEEEIEEKRRVASLDEFTRFEEEQTRKMMTLADNFISEVELLNTKIETQKGYEADLTSFLKSEDSSRLASTDQWADATIKKYGEVAASMRNLISTQGQIRGLGSFSGGLSGSTGSVVPSGGSSVSNVTNNNIQAPVNISGGNAQNLSAQEVSAVLGFELNKQL